MSKKRGPVHAANTDRKHRKYAMMFPNQGPGARQEDKAATDIYALLKRHGAIPPGRALQFGSVDFDVNLQESIHLARQARQAFNTVPIKLRRAFPTWEKLLGALETKTLVVKDGKLQYPEPEPKPPETPKPAPTPTPPTT